MQIFVKISRQIKMFSIQEFVFDRSVCMPAVCYSGLILVIPTNGQLLEEKKTCAKLLLDISKSEWLIHVYTNRQMDMAQTTQLIMLIIQIHIYFTRSPKFLSGCYKLRDKLNIPCWGYNYISIEIWSRYNATCVSFIATTLPLLSFKSFTELLKGLVMLTAPSFQ